MGEFWTGMIELRRHLDELAVDTRLRIQELAELTAAADQKLAERIDSLVSAMGEFMRQQRNGGSNPRQQ